MPFAPADQALPAEAGITPDDEPRLGPVLAQPGDQIVRYDGNRAIVLPLEQEIPLAALQQCITMIGPKHDSNNTVI